MRLAKKRPTTATGSNKGYAVYNSFEDSVTDFYLWMEYTDFPQVNLLRSFIKQMKKRDYFEADLNAYYSGVTKWYDKLYVFNE